MGGDFLSVVFIRSLDEVAGFIREGDQTITYFGWERGKIEAVAATHVGPGRLALGADRDGADFDFIWDATTFIRVDAACARLVKPYWRKISVRALLDANQALEKARPEQIHVARLGRQMRASTSFI